MGAMFLKYPWDGMILIVLGVETISQFISWPPIWFVLETILQTVNEKNKKCQ